MNLKWPTPQPVRTREIPQRMRRCGGRASRLVESISYSVRNSSLGHRVNVELLFRFFMLTFFDPAQILYISTVLCLGTSFEAAHSSVEGYMKRWRGESCNDGSGGVIFSWCCALLASLFYYTRLFTHPDDDTMSMGFMIVSRPELFQVPETGTWFYVSFRFAVFFVFSRANGGWFWRLIEAFYSWPSGGTFASWGARPGSLLYVVLRLK